MIPQPSSAPAEPAPAPAGGAGHPPGRPDAVAAERALVELLALRRELHERDHVRRADGLDRAGDAVRRLGGFGSPDRTVSLVRALRDERRQMRGFLEWTAARSAGLTEAPIRLSTVQHAPEPPPSPPEGPLPGPQRDERAVFDGLLTRRELDVLRLLAEGRTNRAIAQALVISDGTVKFHVNGILRKLRVANRAQAVARYLRLLGMPAP